MQYIKFTETRTWRAWRESMLSNFNPCQSETKALFALLLAAKSPTELEKFCVSSILNDVCKPSVEMRKALKKVWRAMQANNERWVIAAASLEGLGLGIGFAAFYWKQLCIGRPVVSYVWERSIGNQNQIYHDATIVKLTENGEITYLADFKLNSNVNSCHNVWVEFYYPGNHEIFVTMGFDVRVFTESNADLFKKTMPNYSVVEFPDGHERHHDKSICYRLSVNDEDLKRVIEFGDFYVAHLHWTFHFKPKEGFLKFIKARLRDIGMPFADTIIAN